MNNNISSIMDSKTETSEIDKVINYIEDNQSANGYIYGELSMHLLKKLGHTFSC